jgi:hypothetical protein
MKCEHQACHCQSEIGVERNGRTYCSESCARASFDRPESCGCGHAGCSTADELSASA